MLKLPVNLWVAIFFIVGCATVQHPTSQLQTTKKAVVVANNSPMVETPKTSDQHPTSQPQAAEKAVVVANNSPVVETPKTSDINSVISKLSQQISSTMLEQNKRRVAVMNFPLLTGEMTELGLYLSDKLTNSLFQYRDKYEVVERTRLESVLKEMKLGMTGMIDDKTAQSIGKVLGADAIIIGTITDLGWEVDVNLRMLGTERANVLAVANSMLEKNEGIIKLMANVRMPETGTMAVGAKGTLKAENETKKNSHDAPPPALANPDTPFKEFKDFRVEIEALQIDPRDKRLFLFLKYVNKTNKELNIAMTYEESIPVTWFNHYPTYVTDNMGNEYRLSEIGGIGSVCTLRDLKSQQVYGTPLTIPPSGSTTASLRTSTLAYPRQVGSEFSLASEQAVIATDDSGKIKSDKYNNPVVESTFHISILHIKATK